MKTGMTVPTVRECPSDKLPMYHTLIQEKSLPQEGVHQHSQPSPKPVHFLLQYSPFPAQNPSTSYTSTAHFLPQTNTLPASNQSISPSNAVHFLYMCHAAELSWPGSVTFTVFVSVLAGTVGMLTIL